MSNKVQAPSKAYDALKKVVDAMLKCSYRHIEYTGMENLPKDGAIILAPNHTNGLMDALVLLAMDKQPKVYVARADIFRNKKTAKILHFLRIMPIMRARDGLNEVRKNNVTIDASVDVLKDSVPFCILPEGTHRA
ncbi:MAG: 1-acyl-sn-glycerol-3-phosphate acyltransferase, partial [Bacteroidales bacterium]|nr:1-acyl-sn-glycerol-3-phosphate acyltransferase [Bacteroidales bacterium]